MAKSENGMDMKPIHYLNDLVGINMELLLHLLCCMCNFNVNEERSFANRGVENEIK